ncbi:2Fe-2S iron-sulfur cluster binding domain-containing protein [Pigmentibacter sp. JX0631]|uniref:2Fe-2S iron-sulfur cluster binding domain-containing protein n=1 Tax=Pigmentibacter sp. JX0631 TaxID=2976982 RepID=UPI002468B58D|nr:2Fe-2S iron-sulfur cluster binding domain-containing protein [Pigmentibacter sp. JX0631]WGL59999.1 2Fe-2S iron-sulfur cluster binding domain-containing protein [Pigmentibacter sp. JX0631]
MPMVKFNSNNYQISPEQSVLDLLIQNNEDINYFCKSGLCQSCILEFNTGTPPQKSQIGLSEADKLQKKFLSCLCFPEEDISIKKCGEESKKYSTKILQKKLINNEVILLKLEKPKDYSFYPGQFLNIYKDTNCLRSYSIANLCDDKNEIELHIKHFLTGEMSNWIFNELNVGNEIYISQALGSCFFTSDALNKPMLFLGISTGVAPLLGICRQAIFQNHQKAIHFVQGGVNEKSLYANNFLNELKLIHNDFNLFSCCLNSAKNSNVLNFIEENYVDLENWKVYICGDSTFVKAAKELVFLQGANSQDIHSDSFLFKNN